jgi:sulfur-oxidizing protein SoxB
LQNAGTNLKDALTRPVYDVTADYIRRQKNVNIDGTSNVKILDYDCGCPRKGSRS